MRKRLYQALPEHSELIDSVQSVCKEKTRKRLYAESNVTDHDAKTADVTDYFESLDEFFTLAAGQIDSLYALYDYYGRECMKMPQVMCSGWSHTAATSAVVVDWYMRTGKSAWEKTFAIAYSPFLGSR